MPNTQTAQLRMRLKGFALPDTSSEFEGYVELGTYAVLNTKSVGGNDFALLEVPHLGAGDTWICARSAGVVYADVRQVLAVPTPRLTFAADPLAVAEATLVDLFADFDGYQYDHDEAYYPWPLPGVNVAEAAQGKKQNNCCTFVEALTVQAFARALPASFEWDMEKHRQMMINVDDRYAPVTAAIESTMAIPATSPDAPPHPWTLVQGWHGEQLSKGGHTFLVVDHEPISDRVLILESNCTFNLNGPGYRQFGPLEKFGRHAPAKWQEDPKCWTWRLVCSTYRLRQQATLRVKERSLSGL